MDSSSSKLMPIMPTPTTHYGLVSGEMRASSIVEAIEANRVFLESIDDTLGDVLAEQARIRDATEGVARLQTGDDYPL